MKESWELNEKDLDRFLDWLDAERGRAAQRYEDIRRSLVIMFRSRGLAEAEDLADETIDRVIKRVVNATEPFVADKARYFHAVAYNLFLQKAKRKANELALDDAPQLVDRKQTPPTEAEEKERVYGCLERCLGRFPAEERTMVLAYYQQEKQARIEQRKALAERYGLELGALRLRVFRARAELERCIEKCLKH